MFELGTKISNKLINYKKMFVAKLRINVINNQ